MSMLSVATVFSSGTGGILGVGPRAEKAALFRVPRREEDASTGPLTLLGRARIGFRDLEERDRAGAVVVGAVEDTALVGAVMVEVGANHDPLVLK